MNLDMAEQPCARIDSFVPVVWLPIAAARLEPASGHRWWIVQVCRHNSAFGDHRHGDGLLHGDPKIMLGHRVQISERPGHMLMDAFPKPMAEVIAGCTGT